MKSKVQNTEHCQVRIVKYNDRDYRVQKDRNGFEYIKVSEDGKRKIIAISKLEPDDEVFNYIFNYGFRDRPDSRLDALARERIYKKPKKQFMISIYVKLKSGESKTCENSAFGKRPGLDYKYSK